MKTFILFCLTIFSLNAYGEQSNCWFIPGCISLLEGSDGPFNATIITYENIDGSQETRLSVNYTENLDSEIRLCRERAALTKLLIVLGQLDERYTLQMPLSLYCPDDYGNRPEGATQSARWSITAGENPELWDVLFPPDERGKRRYQLELAVFNSLGQWDSFFGRNYFLELKPKTFGRRLD